MALSPGSLEIESGALYRRAEAETRRSDQVRPVATNDIGPVHVDLNAGVNVWQIEDRPAPQAFAVLALSANIVRPFGVMLEGYAFSQALPVSRRDGGGLFALSHSPKPWLVFDLEGDLGMFPSTHPFATFVGMTIVPAILWRRTGT